MKVKIEAVKKEYVDVEIDKSDAFRILCQTLDMEWILNDEFSFYIRENEYEERTVWLRVYGGSDKEFDERGDLFLALCKLAGEIFLNCELRNPLIVKVKEE